MKAIRSPQCFIFVNFTANSLKVKIFFYTVLLKNYSVYKCILPLEYIYIPTYFIYYIPLLL